MTGRLKGMVLLLMVVLVGGTPARPVAAQTAPPGGLDAPRVAPAAPGRGARAMRPSAGMTVLQVEQYFDQVMLSQARTRLRLTDRQFFQFGGALRRLQMLRRQQQRQRLTLVRELGALVDGTADDDAIAAKTRELDEFNEQAWRALQEARAAVDQMLDVKQRAQFRVFEDTMERRKLDLLARARQAAAPRYGTPPAP